VSRKDQWVLIMLIVMTLCFVFYAASEYGARELWFQTDWPANP